MDLLGSHARRLAVGAIALALVAVSATSYVSWSRGRDQLIELLAEMGTGAREPGVVSDVRREPDPDRARLLVARALLADELDRRWLNDLTAAEREDAESLSLRKLDTALALAREVLAEQPASWQARMILAGSTYLKMSRQGDPLRWRERFRWEQPLRDAMAMATSQVEPRRILAAAYLNDWSLMTSAERSSARDVLRVAFRDRATLEQLLPTWLRRADSLDQALELVPAELSSWQLVERFFTARQDWERVCEAQRRSFAIVQDHAERLLADAAKRQAAGDRGDARWFALRALASLPVGPQHTDLLERILLALPAGPVSKEHQERTKDWLAWTQRECLLGDCPVSKAAVQRLRALSQYEASADRAWVAELAGDAYSAEFHERNALVPNSPDWTPHLLLKAKRLALSGETAKAAALMTLLHPSAADMAAGRAVREIGQEGLGASKARADRTWQTPLSLASAAPSVREFYWQEPPEKIRLRFGYVSPGGGAVQILWSDRIQSCHRVDAGSVLTLAPPQNGGFHILEVRGVAGTRASIAELRISP